MSRANMTVNSFRLFKGTFDWALPKDSLPTSSRVGRIGSFDYSGLSVEVARRTCTWSLFWKRMEEPIEHVQVMSLSAFSDLYPIHTSTVPNWAEPSRASAG